MVLQGLDDFLHHAGYVLVTKLKRSDSDNNSSIKLYCYDITAANTCVVICEEKRIITGTNDCHKRGYTYKIKKLV